jgi:hypothetical protein
LLAKRPALKFQPAEAKANWLPSVLLVALPPPAIWRWLS